MGSRMKSIFGALLILVSTFVTGVVTYSIEIEISDINSKISSLNTKSEKATNIYEYALISDDIASLRKTVVNVGIYQTEDIQKSFQAAYAASIYSNIQHLLSAAGRDKDITGKYGKDLKKLRDDIIKGLKPSSDLKHIYINLMEESANYRGDLIIEIAKLSNKKNELEKETILYRVLAIALQLIGLIFLLFNELPKREKHA